MLPYLIISLFKPYHYAGNISSGEGYFREDMLTAPKSSSKR